MVHKTVFELVCFIVRAQTRAEIYNCVRHRSHLKTRSVIHSVADSSK